LPGRFPQALFFPGLAAAFFLPDTGMGAGNRQASVKASIQLGMLAQVAGETIEQHIIDHRRFGIQNWSSPWYTSPFIA
jgi:hypothetical protein